MKKSTILILSAIFTIAILNNPIYVKAAPSGATLIVDYENENFQEFYSTNIEPKLDLIIERCRAVTEAENVLIGYSKSPFDNTTDTFVCYNVDFTENIEAYVDDTGTSSAKLKLTFPNTNYRIINVSDLSNVSSLSTSSTISAFNATSYDSLLNEFETDFILSNSLSLILFYNDKDNIIFTNNDENGLYISGTYVQYGETISLYANSEQSFLPSDFDYFDYTVDLEANIPSLNLSIKLPIIQDKIPYSFTYNSYFILNDGENEGTKYFLEGAYIDITEEDIYNYSDIYKSRKYNLFSNATYYFEIYQGNSLEEKDLLYTETYTTEDINNTFTTDKYIDYQNKNNTSNILGGSIFSNFQTSDYGFTSIITAPLRLINSFDTNVCTAPSIPILGTDFTLPCGQTFWNREDITEFKEIYQIIIYGFLCYYIGIDIIRTIQDLKNPDDSKLNVIDL